MVVTRGALLLVSALAHGVVYAALPADGGPASWPLVEVDMVVEEPLEPLPPAPVPVPVPEHAPARSPTPRAHRDEPPPAAPVPSPAAPPPLADLTGTTLTSPTGPGWEIDPGSGERRDGPVGPGGARPAAPAPAPAGNGGGGLRLVGAGDLSRPPAAPILDALLMRHYPADARRAGLAGSAIVRVRILADGRVASVRVLSASEPAFGAACRATLSESPRWSAPLDRGGAAVATEVRYRCRFEVE